MNSDPFISVVSPVYRAEGIIHDLVLGIKIALEPITANYEIILVNDGSPDQSWKEIYVEATEDIRVKGINLSRNFGQHQALLCALENSRGEFVIAMDCDLQDNPKYLPTLLAEVQKGYDIVYTAKKRTGHSSRKNLSAWLFTKVFNFLVDNEHETNNVQVGTFSILSRKVVNAFCDVNDYQRLYLMTLRWLGFQSSTIYVEHQKRHSGKSAYTFSKLWKHAINGITYQSNKLLVLNITIGFILAVLSMISALTVVILYFTHGFLSGWTSIIITLFFSLGVILISIGIVGLYISKIFDQVKDRPKYVVDISVNIHNPKSQKGNPLEEI